MKFSNLILFLFFSITINAQTTVKSQLDLLPETIENQFLEIFKKGNSWHEYKMIKKTEFISFQKNILDSVSNLKKGLTAKQQLLNSQETSITTLNDSISLLKKDLTVALSKEDSISFFGAQMQKSFYNTILFSAILGLLAALLFFIFKFNNSNVITYNAKKSLITTEEELNLYKKKSIEKEQKLRRQLQDEINKQRGV